LERRSTPLALDTQTHHVQHAGSIEEINRCFQ
jgi:hypothetical protein